MYIICTFGVVALLTLSFHLSLQIKLVSNLRFVMEFNSFQKEMYILISFCRCCCGQQWKFVAVCLLQVIGVAEPRAFYREKMQKQHNIPADRSFTSKVFLLIAVCILRTCLCMCACVCNPK